LNLQKNQILSFLNLYIGSAVIIRKQSVIKNGAIEFQSQESDINLFLRSVYDSLEVSYPKFHKMDNLNKLGWLAAEFLLQDIDKSPLDKESTGIVLANSSSSLDTDERYLASTKTIPSPALFVYTLPNIVIGEICIWHGLKGENTFFVCDSFDITFMHQYTTQLFESESVNVCIMGWVEQYHEHYETALYLVQKEKSGIALPFTIKEVEKFYEQ
jgi:hypothetical protein